MRNFKTLGLALVAALAMSAVVASAAQAGPAAITVEGGGTAILTGKQEAGTNTTFTRQGRTVTCHSESLEATVSNKATTATVTPKYSNCTSSLGPATVTMNSCDYIFHLEGDATGGEDTWTATADLDCTTPGDKAYIHVYSSTTNHTNNVVLCTYEFEEQPGLGTIELTNKSADATTPKDWITADIEVEGIDSKRTAGSTLICGSENDTAGTLDGVAEIKGENHVSAALGITVSTH